MEHEFAQGINRFGWKTSSLTIEHGYIACIIAACHEISMTIYDDESVDYNNSFRHVFFHFVSCK